MQLMTEFAIQINEKKIVINIRVVGYVKYLM